MADNKIFGKINVKATGVTFDNRQYKLKRIERFDGPFVTLLKREPGNKYDENAIQILVKTGDTVSMIGYVPADKAGWLAKLMDQGRIVRAYHGHIIGGSGRAATFGYALDIAYEIPQPVLK